VVSVRDIGAGIDPEVIPNCLQNLQLGRHQSLEQME